MEVFFIYSHELNRFCMIYKELHMDGFDLTDEEYRELKQTVDKVP